MDRSCFRKRSRHNAQGSRRGAALVLVMMIISLALAVSYGVLRSQETQVRISTNSNSKSQARQAALGGMAVALRKINEADWAGVNTNLSGTLSAEQGYTISYTSGDSNLTSADADYDDLPFRVTIESTGYSPASASAANRTQFKMRAVVQLVPRLLNSLNQPANWDTLNSHTVYQFGDYNSYVELPTRIEGSVHLEGTLNLYSQLPPENSVSSTLKKPFDGLIDEVAVFNKALSQSEIQGINDAARNSQNVVSAYAAKTPLAWWRFQEPFNALVANDSVGSTHGYYQGAESGQAGASIAAGNKAGRFDGEDDYVWLGNGDVTGSALTILAWFKADDFGTSDGRIISKATGIDNDDHNWMLSTIDSGSSTRLRFRVKAGGSTTALTAWGGSLTRGEWVFAAAVYDGFSMRIYKDGSLVGWTLKSGSLNTNSSAPIYIGNNPTLPWESPRSRYLRDLGAMHVSGAGDYRPFDGPLELSHNKQSDLTIANLEEDLMLTTQNVNASTAQLSQPSGLTSYRLFAGGPSYTIEILSNTLQTQTLEPDPATNPLGIYRTAAGLRLRDDVTIRGTLLVGNGSSSDDLTLDGTNIAIEPVALRPLANSTATWQLPSTVVGDDILVDDNTTVNITGMCIAGDDFRINDGTAPVSLNLTGRLLVRELALLKRNAWSQSDSWWWAEIFNFYSQFLAGGAGACDYFPEYLSKQFSLDPTPDVTIKSNLQADGSEPAYLWPDWTQPIYLPHPDDADAGDAPGLRWDLVRWEEGV